MKLRQLIEKHWDILSYLLFGGLTTLVNFIVYTPFHRWLHLSAALSNIIAWVAAVAFAFLTNKPFVFKSHDWSAETVVPELAKFVGCRIASGLLETAIIGLTVDILHWHDLGMKLICAVLVVLLNYIGSKWLVFKKNGTA